MHKQEIDSDLAWAMLLTLNRKPVVPLPCSLSVTKYGEVLIGRQAQKNSLLFVTKSGWQINSELSKAASILFELYLPLCRPCCTASYIVAHLGQSLDGRIATHSGASSYVTGPENIIHLHRMRALFDAVLVGADTIFYDDPQLTTRKVAGPNPVRIVLDPRRRLHAGYRLFSDAAAKTLWVSGDSGEDVRCHSESLETISAPCRDGRLSLVALIEKLADRGVARIFIEGGGVTVSRFLEEGLLNRLQITVSPMIIGSGRPGLSLGVIDDLAQGLRPQTRRFLMGDDVFFECLFKP